MFANHSEKPLDVESRSAPIPFLAHTLQATCEELSHAKHGLGQLVTDVIVLVDETNRDEEASDDSVEHHEVLDRVMQFETKHPRVSSFLAQVTDLLAMMGI